MKKQLLLIIALLFAKVIFAQPQCYFTQSQNGALNSFTFTPAASLPTSYSYLWDFGDSTISTDSVPMHVYNSYGLFWVCLTVYDSAQTQVCQWCDTISINPSG